MKVKILADIGGFHKSRVKEVADILSDPLGYKVRKPPKNPKIPVNGLLLTYVMVERLDGDPK